MNDKAETLNGRAAMIGFIAAIGAYLTQDKSSPESGDVSIIIGPTRCLCNCCPPHRGSR